MYGVLPATFIKSDELFVYKHLTIEQRVLIENRLNKHCSVRSIAKELGVSPSTILREINRHITTFKAKLNDCSNRRNCIYKSLCGEEDCNRYCAKCKTIKCGKYCTDYVKAKCPKLETSPYVCNGCKSFYTCENERHVYSGSTADKQYKETLVSTRTGFDITTKEMERIDKIASPLIKNGLSPYHVKQTLSYELPVSESTLRRMIDRCELNARNVDLRVKVKLNPRDTTKNKARNKELSVSKIGHFYTDYLHYIEENDTFTVEMNCVEGKKDETDALLTLTWTNLSLQIAIR